MLKLITIKMNEMRMLLQIIFLLISFSGLAQVTFVSKGKKITIEGTTVNLCVGAAVRTKDHFFVIENLYNWKTEEENQQVIVTGKLVVYTTYVTKKDPSIQYAPLVQMLRRPKIKMVGNTDAK